MKMLQKLFVVDFEHHSLKFGLQCSLENIPISLHHIFYCLFRLTNKFVFHQASKYILDNICRRLKITKNQTYENYGRVGNTISASIPIALKHGFSSKKIKKNNSVIIAGYGVGLSWGSALIKFDKIL